MDANDPIPAGAIRLTDAYQAVLRRHIDWDVLIKDIAIDRSKRIDDFVNVKIIKDAGIRDESDRTCAVDLAERVAERFFRSALSDGHLRPFVRDPMNGQLLQLLSAEDWARCGFLPGITSDFVDPDDLFCPGPDSTVGGARRPVFFLQAEFDGWLQSSAGSPPSLQPRDGKSKAGAKPKFDWEDIKAFVFKIMNERGDFDHADPTDDWKSQNDLLRLIVQYVERRPGAGEGPSMSVLKARVPQMIEQWRQSAGN